MKTDPGKIEELLNEALNLPLDQRDAFLLGACGKDHELRKKVETLLHAHGEAEGFLSETPTMLSAAIAEGPGTRIGRYRLIQQIGEGGMGVVYMAEQEEPVRGGSPSRSLSWAWTPARSWPVSKRNARRWR